MPVIPGGEVEVARVTNTSGASGVSSVGTSWATGSNFFSSNLSFVADGTSTYVLEFFAPLMYSPSIAQQLAIRISASDGTSDGGIISFSGNAAAEGSGVFGRALVTPSAGTATYNARFAASTGTGQIYCGSGGAGAYLPAYLRAMKIVNQNDGLKPFWTPPIVTQLPTQATVGDQVIYAADATNGVYWHLSYDGLGTYPWKFIGGPALRASTSGTATVASTTYTTTLSDGAGGVTAVTAPIAGDYDVRFGMREFYPPSNGQISYAQVGTSTPGDSVYAVQMYSYNANGTYWNQVASSVVSEKRLTGVSAAAAISIYYKVGSGTLGATDRWMSVTPIRVKAA